MTILGVFAGFIGVAILIVGITLVIGYLTKQFDNSEKNEEESFSESLIMTETCKHGNQHYCGLCEAEKVVTTQ